MIRKDESSFIAYVDESGDIGINPNKPGSSQWFGIAAFVVRASKDAEIVGHKKNILKTCGIQTKDIHMKNIGNEDKRRYVVKEAAAFESRCIVVLSNKCSLYNKGTFNTKDSYYQYMSRYLLERITKCCSDWRRTVPDGNGKVKIVFATRGGMNYDKFKEYLHALKDSPLVNDKIKRQNLPSIDWDVIDIDDVQNIPAENRAGLQFADVLSYSFFKAVNKNEFGMTNTGYCYFFKHRMHRCDDRVWHNGVTIVNASQMDENDLPLQLENVFRIQVNQNRTKKSIRNTGKIGDIAKITRK